MSYIDFTAIVREAWQAYDDTRTIFRIVDISAKVSTNHVYRITFEDHSIIIAKLAYYGKFEHFVEDHTIINSMSNNLPAPFENVMARSLMKGNSLFVYRYANHIIDAWVVFYRPIHIKKRLPKRLDEELIEKFGLKQIFDKPMRTLSGGTRQKVSAALAFLFDPGVLILDEPTAGLDPLSSEILKEKILKEKSKNKLILITSHILSDLDELTTHIIYLQEGKLEFFKEIDQLREETGEIKLGKAIARIMKGEKFNSKWIDGMFVVGKIKDEKNSSLPSE